MKILLVSRFARSGGASLAMNRLGDALLGEGNEVRVLAADRGEEWEGFKNTRGEQWAGKVLWRLGLDHLHTRGSFRLAGSDWLESFDVVHLHNLHAGFFNYLALPRLSARKPVVWTLHDMWAFTGHCGYSLECERWRTGCGKCPHLHTYPYMHRDASALEWRLKAWSYGRSRLHVTAPSRWLTEAARESPLLGRHPVSHVPYSIDAGVWKPADRAAARERFGVPEGAQVLLVVANDLSEPRKGGHLLREILRALPEASQENCVLLVAGKGSAADLEGCGPRVCHAGYLETDEDRCLLYSAADLMLFTSMADNLPLVLMEAMACGLPVVAFNVGGVGDLVREGQTGRLVQAFDTEAYARVLVEMLDAPNEGRRQGEAARAVIQTEYTPQREAQSMSAIYEQVCEEARSRR